MGIVIVGAYTDGQLFAKRTNAGNLEELRLRQLSETDDLVFCELRVYSGAGPTITSRVAASRAKVAALLAAGTPMVIQIPAFADSVTMLATEEELNAVGYNGGYASVINTGAASTSLAAKPAATGNVITNVATRQNNQQAYLMQAASAASAAIAVRQAAQRKNRKTGVLGFFQKIDAWVANVTGI